MDSIFSMSGQLTLDDYMRFSIARRSTMGESLPLLVYRLLEFSIKEELMEKLGAEEQKRIFRGAGYRAGAFFTKHLLDSSLGQDAFIAQLQEKLKELNLGILRIESADEDGKIILTVAEDADCSGLPLLGETVCHYDEGFISGIFSVYMKKSYTAVEVDCWATGDKLCRFHVMPEAE